MSVEKDFFNLVFFDFLVEDIVMVVSVLCNEYSMFFSCEVLSSEDVIWYEELEKNFLGNC